MVSFFRKLFGYEISQGLGGTTFNNLVDLLLSQKRLILTPGEMAQAKLTPQQLEQARGQTVTIEITKEKQN